MHPNTAPALPATVYLVSWTGGIEDPSFQSYTNQSEADATYERWVSEANDSADRITLVEQSIAQDGVVLNTVTRNYCPAWESSED